MPKRLKAPRAGVEDFFPWVSPISIHPPASEEEEDEEEMADLVHNFGTQKSKRGVNFKRVTGATPEVADEVSQQPSCESLDVQVIAVSDSP